MLEANRDLKIVAMTNEAGISRGQVTAAVAAQHAGE